MMPTPSKTAYSFTLLFIVAFLLVPFAQSSFMSMMPGDIGDARLNNYFLENIYQFLAGRSESLWHLSFFSPFPYVLGFSDNLFGSSPVYLLARVLTGQPDTAFQIWYFFGYFANFLASYYALNRLGNSWTASAVGALIFAFALPVTAHSGHSQLHYRFGVPLAVAMFILFIDKKDWQYFVASAAWLVWQFYCTIYIGFFTLLMMVAISSVYFFKSFRAQPEAWRLIVIDFVCRWRDQPSKTKCKILLALFLLLILLILLFYPYLRVTQLYGANRSLAEIASMLPRPQSYFLSDGSWLWSSQSKVFTGIPMRHEHQMFFGAVPLLLAVIGFLFGNRDKNGIAFFLLAGSLAALMVLTLNMGGFSLWFLFAKLPLASAIRAMTRIDQVLLFPVAYLTAVAVDHLRNHAQWISKLLFVAVIPLMIFEFSATSPSLSAKSEWQKRLIANEAAFPKQLPQNSILFFAQSNGPFFAAELDAMWVAMKHGAPTLNGYSGILPPAFASEYGKDCSELPKRILSYLAFTGRQGNTEAYINLMQRVVPIGFIGCEKQWFSTLPAHTTTNRVYSPDEMSKLSLQYTGKTKTDGQWVVDIRISNAGHHLISAASSIGKSVRLSWRFMDPSGTPKSGWDTRKDLPFDIPAKGYVDIQIPVTTVIEIQEGSLQVSIVQEGAFWVHDHGLVPLLVPWD